MRQLAKRAQEKINEKTVAVFLCLIASGVCQKPSKPQFEVASIKQVEMAGLQLMNPGEVGIFITKTSVEIKGATIRRMIAEAFGVNLVCVGLRENRCVFLNAK